MIEDMELKFRAESRLMQEEILNQMREESMHSNQLYQRSLDEKVEDLMN